ncbi:MAG: molecular chaperone HtpG [Spirochaetaceae bacterium]|nr:molecular chaperone HtpG [Spirochaetaceae bacterium]
MAAYQFQTEVSQLLELITHSLYSHKEVFLRELVSNASDAIDKLNYLTVSDDAYKTFSFQPRITVKLDEDARTIIVSDNGIGMDQTELADNLGTIARSGTRAFLERLGEQDRKASNLIGQFGVGFYSAFMVADQIEVISRKPGSEQAWLWKSDGKSGFDIEPAIRDGHGTDVVLHINENGTEFLSRWTLEDLLRRYSNHIAWPIHLVTREKTYAKDPSKAETKVVDEQVNAASALWRRPKSELSAQDYIDFYKSLTGDDREPLFWIHTHAEGTIEYSSLLYIPSHVPADLYIPTREQGIKLYIKRVFITDRELQILPPYFRFVRGVIESDDLPLNVSREMLQHNRVLTTIQQATLKKLFSELEQLSTANPEKFARFVSLFNPQIKEGIVSDWTNREQLLKLVRYKSTMVDGWTSLADYKSRAGEQRKAIFYLSGDNEERLRQSPLLEAYTKQGIEVLLGTDEIDELAFAGIGEYEGLALKSVQQADSDEVLDKLDADLSARGEKAAAILARILGERVKSVRISRRLGQSPSCLVIEKDEPTPQYRRLMERLTDEPLPPSKPILEINPSHHLIEKLVTLDTRRELTNGAIEVVQQLEDLSLIILYEAMLAEGDHFEVPADFTERLNRLLSRALA